MLFMHGLNNSTNRIIISIYVLYFEVVSPIDSLSQVTTVAIVVFLNLFIKYVGDSCIIGTMDMKTRAIHGYNKMSQFVTKFFFY